MPKYKITYFKQYKVTADTENDGVEITDQRLTDAIREMISSQGSGKIHHIFHFNIQKL